MAITLGSEAVRDAELTDRIGRGDVDAAAGLWVRYWSTALGAARQYVEPDEVPGLAAEALIGTIAAITVGRGPREDLSSFVTAAVAELGESDVPPSGGAAPVPDVFVSPLMTRAFAGLSGEDQEILWLTGAAGESDQLIAEALDLPLPMAAEARTGALTALQRDYLAEHTEQADATACHQAHGAMAAAVSRDVPLAGATWVHMSECAWCTEAFHELAFSNVAIDVLVDRGAVTPVPVTPVPAAAIVPAASVVPAEAANLVEPVPAETPSEPDLAPSGSHAAASSPVSRLRGRRTRLAGGAVLAAAAITAAVLVVTGPDDSDGTLTTAGTEQTQDEPAALPGVFDSVAPPVVDEPVSPTPTPTPLSTPTARPTPGEQPSSTPRPTPATSAEPTQPPTPKPTATAEPTPTPTSPTSPTPTPTPTSPPCNDLAHFLGFC